MYPSPSLSISLSLLIQSGARMRLLPLSSSHDIHVVCIHPMLPPVNFYQLDRHNLFLVLMGGIPRQLSILPVQIHLTQIDVCLRPSISIADVQSDANYPFIFCSIGNTVRIAVSHGL